eukprot:757734-Hanusia_phi.AAC.4
MREQSVNKTRQQSDQHRPERHVQDGAIRERRCLVVLSDFGNVGSGGGSEGESNSVVERALQPRNLLENLHVNVELNQLQDKCDVVRLDWHSCLADSFRWVSCVYLTPSLLNWRVDL